MDNSSSNSSTSTGSGDWLDTKAIVYISAEVVNALVSLVGNSIVVAAILRTSQLHTVTNVFVVSLALADVVVGFLVSPLAVSVYKSFYVDFYICILVNTAILMFTNISILMLMAVAVERFLAISRPFTYVRLMTVKRAVVINVLVWLLGIVLGLVPMYGWHKSKSSYTRCAFVLVIPYTYMVYFQFFGLVLLPLFIMLVIYIYILRVVHYHTARDNRHNSLFQAGGMTKKQKREFQKDVKAAKYFALIILLFAIFWLPVNIINTISLFWPEHFPPTEVLLVAIVLSHANSSINPFLYAASNTRIKRAMKATLHIRRVRDDSELTDLPRDQRASSASLNGREPTGGASNAATLAHAAVPASGDNVTLSRPPGDVVTLTNLPNGKSMTQSAGPAVGKGDSRINNTVPAHANLYKEHAQINADGPQHEYVRSEIVLGVNCTQQPRTEPLGTHGEESLRQANGLKTPNQDDSRYDSAVLQPPGCVDGSDSNSHISVSSEKESHKNLINGYLKHNQVHPISDTLIRNKQVLNSVKKPSKNGGHVHWEKDKSKANSLHEASGYYNLAFNPEDILNDEKKNMIVHNDKDTFSELSLPESNDHNDPPSTQPCGELERFQATTSSQSETNFANVQSTANTFCPDSEQSQNMGPTEVPVNRDMSSEYRSSDDASKSQPTSTLPSGDASEIQVSVGTEDDVIVLDAGADAASIGHTEGNGDVSNELQEEWTFVSFSAKSEGIKSLINCADEWTKL